MSDQDLNALVSSRICHDLVSPLGAIGNGVEMLGMTGAAEGPEVGLIADSARQANARLRLFRVAFGAAGGRAPGRGEVLDMWDDLFAGGRTRCDWRIEADPDRAELRAIYLGLICLETALIRGGTLTAARDGADVLLGAEGGDLRHDADLWAALEGDVPEVSPAQVQFALLPRALEHLDRPGRLTVADGRMTLRF